jgi:hypothetical protein
MHFEFNVDGNGFALLPPEAMDDLDDEVRFALNAVFDPEGRTCAALDWQEASWELAWTKAAARVESEWLVPHGGLLALTGDGRFHLAVRRLTDEERGRVASTVTSRMHLEGELLLVDGVGLFQESDTNEHRLEVPDGACTVRLHCLTPHADDARVVGEFGTGGHPALVLEVEAAGVSSQQSGPIHRLPFLAEERGPRPGWLCRAEVSRLTEAGASFKLEGGGYGRAQLSGDQKARPGERVTVRVLRWDDGVWRVELL